MLMQILEFTLIIDPFSGELFFFFSVFYFLTKISLCSNQSWLRYRISMFQEILDDYTSLAGSWLNVLFRWWVFFNLFVFWLFHCNNPVFRTWLIIAWFSVGDYLCCYGIICHYVSEFWATVVSCLIVKKASRRLSFWRYIWLSNS